MKKIIFKERRENFYFLNSLLLIFLGVISMNQVIAMEQQVCDKVGYCNPNLPHIVGDEVITTSPTNNTIGDVNNSQFLRGYYWVDAPYPAALYSTFNTTYDTWAYNQTLAVLPTNFTNVAYLNNTQTFTNQNSFNNATFFNTSLMVINVTNGQIREGIQTNALTTDLNRYIRHWIIDTGNLSWESMRISASTRPDQLSVPLLSLSNDYKSAVSFGAVYRFEVQRTNNATLFENQLCLKVYDQSSTGNLALYGTPICFQKQSIGGNNAKTVFPGYVRNFSIDAEPYVSTFGATDAARGGLRIGREGPSFKAESVTEFIPYTYQNTSVASQTKLLIRQANSCGLGFGCATDTVVGAILSRAGGLWYLGSDGNGTSNNTLTVSGNVNITNSGKLFVEGNTVMQNLTGNNASFSSFVNTNTNFTVLGQQGITKRMQILKDIDFVGLTKTYCNVSIIGGIVNETDC